MVALILSIAALVLVAALIWVGNRQVGAVLRMLAKTQPRDTPAEAPHVADLKAMWDHIYLLERQQKEVFQAVADGIDHVDRNEKRVRGIVLGAKRRFETEGYVDPGVEAEADTLPLFDGASGPEEEVRAVSGAVEATGPNPFQGVPGTIPVDFDGTGA